MSIETTTGPDDEMWVIDGEPGAYVARPVGPPCTEPWERKYELRAAIHSGDITRPAWVTTLDTKGRT